MITATEGGSHQGMVRAINFLTWQAIAVPFAALAWIMARYVPQSAPLTRLTRLAIWWSIVPLILAAGLAIYIVAAPPPI